MRPEPHSILAIVPNWLGDVAMCTPALRALRTRFPKSVLILGGPPAACALLNDLPWFDQVVVFPRRPGFTDVSAFVRNVRKAAAGAPDLAVLFPHSLRSALMARLTGARRRLGYARGGRTWLLTDRVAPHRENGVITPIYMAREYLNLLTPLGYEDDGRGLELRADASTLEIIASRMGATRPRIGLACGAAFGPSKLWPAERYAAVADRLHDQLGAQCVIITGPGEEATRRAVLAAAKTPILECDAGAPTLDTLKATIAQLDLLIGNDSGPRHIAIAFGVPVVCLMGPTSPRYTDSPYERGRVLRIDVDCGPCQKPVCETDHRCMTGIPVEEVVAAAIDILASQR